MQFFIFNQATGNKFTFTGGDTKMIVQENLTTSPKDNNGEGSLKPVVSFLTEIGISVKYDTLTHQTFLPGVCISNGCIIIDREKLKYPGDILHEAGHIAVVPGADRALLTQAFIEKREMREAEEMMAIAWSYAACVHLGIDAAFVFHNNGYKGGGSSIAENFREGRYFGVPVLKWVGMCNNPEEENGYPKMIKWLRD